MFVITAEKMPTENTLSLLRRFTKKVRGGGFLSAVRERQYRIRPQSLLRKKKRILKSIETTKKYERLRKLGKLPTKEIKK